MSQTREELAGEIYSFQVEQIGNTTHAQAFCAVDPSNFFGTNETPEGRQFEEFNATADFMGQHPGAQALLRSHGFECQKTRTDDGSITIKAIFPGVSMTDAHDSTTLSFVPFTGGSYTSQEFLEPLSRNQVLLSDDDGDYAIHDNLVHRPMWELVGTIPDLLSALRSRAQFLLDKVAEFPVEDASTFGPEAAEIAVARALAKKNCDRFMENLDFTIAIGGDMADAMDLQLAQIAKTPANERLGSSLMRNLFPDTEYLSYKGGHYTRDQEPKISWEQCFLWADELMSYSGRHSFISNLR
jgi:hypothetical protein